MRAVPTAEGGKHVPGLVSKRLLLVFPPSAQGWERHRRFSSSIQIYQSQDTPRASGFSSRFPVLGCPVALGGH